MKRTDDITDAIKLALMTSVEWCILMHTSSSLMTFFTGTC